MEKYLSAAETVARTAVYGPQVSKPTMARYLPIALFGRGDGSIKPGRFIAYDKPTPMTNLHVTMLTTAGVQAESIGDSTGNVEQLAEV